MPASPEGHTKEPVLEKIDATGMRPPDNILAVLKKSAELPKDAWLDIRIDANPVQLYDLLQQRGYFLELKRQENGTYAGIARPRATGADIHRAR